MLTATSLLSVSARSIRSVEQDSRKGEANGFDFSQENCKFQVFAENSGASGKKRT